jgi:putative aldouronate transport system permease protein
MYGLQLAFRKFDSLKGLTGGEFVGLDYFRRFIQGAQFESLIKNTFLISFLTLLVGFPVPIFLALVFNQIKNARHKKIIQTIAYVPHFISMIVLVGMLMVFLSPSSGIAGNIYRAFGKEAINIMGEQEYFRLVYVLSEVWQHAGWNSIIYIAALAGIDTQLYEAAKVDGASKWKRIIYIDIPCLIPTIIILLILNAGNVMSVGFEKVYLMQNSLNMTVSEVISTYTYKIGIMNNQISYSSAIGLFNTLINFVFLVTVNFISKKTSKTSLW